MDESRADRRYPTALGTNDAEQIALLGRSVADDLMGKVGFAELAFWLVAQRRPEPGQLRAFEAVLVGLTDHGLTPTAISARLTYYSAPDSLQGAVAAGILGGGSRLLGVTEDAGRVLHRWLRELPAGADPEDDLVWDALAARAVRAEREAGRFFPGLGHKQHKAGDPRTPVLLRIADEEHVAGPHLRLLGAVGRVHPAIIGRTLPLNAAGVSGALLADLGLPPELLRGFSLLARTAGVLGHIAEERHRPLGPAIYREVDDHAVYAAADWTDE